MFNKAKLMATSDLEVAVNTKNQAPDNCKILYIGEPLEKPNIDCINATALCPNYYTLQIFIEAGECKNYIDSYTDYLQRTGAETIATILCALMNGTNIVLYFPYETLELKYPGYLLQYLEVYFGITAQTKSTDFNYNPSYNSNNLRMLYINRLISPADFVLNSEEIDDICIQKLKQDYLQKYPMISTYTPDQMIKWIEDLKVYIANNGTDWNPNMIPVPSRNAFSTIV